MSSTTRQVVSRAAAVAVPVVLVAGGVPSAMAGDATTDSVRSAYRSWVRAVQTADCEGTKVSRMYTRDAILLATFTSYVRGRKAITGYFDNLTCNEDLRVTTQRITTGRTAGMAYSTGLYTFSYDKADGQRVTAPARFTFVYVRRGDTWVIVNHHSSQVP